MDKVVYAVRAALGNGFNKVMRSWVRIGAIGARIIRQRFYAIYGRTILSGSALPSRRAPSYGLWPEFTNDSPCLTTRSSHLCPVVALQERLKFIKR